VTVLTRGTPTRSRGPDVASVVSLPDEPDLAAVSNSRARLRVSKLTHGAIGRWQVNVDRPGKAGTKRTENDVVALALREETKSIGKILIDFDKAVRRWILRSPTLGGDGVSTCQHVNPGELMLHDNIPT